jgi:tetratricopeptide (TPR) repeat protein
MGTFRFKAFISYSHRDREWGAWLQSALESYRIPKRLVGIDSEFGPVPKRLTPVFRDREDLSSASDLSATVKESLEASESLIVICSPAAAQSTWVNEEIRYFRSLGRGDRIFALIVDGDPQPDDLSQQCFPSALVLGPDGSSHEPLAADARKWADGKLLAKLKIFSGILGIRLDDLRQRNMQRRRRNWFVASISTAVLLLVTGTLLLTTLTSQKAVRLQRSNTEELLRYMLGNLKRLDPIVGLEVIDEEDQQMLELFRTLGFNDMDRERLIESGMAWREEGMDSHEHGRLDEAMERFQRSRAAFIELYQREGSTKQALFELGQAEFWVGYVHYDNGELDEARERFIRYGAITRRLINDDPNDAEMVMELSYTLTNLGGVELARTDPDTDKALGLHQSAVQYNQIALVLDPGNGTYQTALNNKLAFLADAWMNTCDLGKAIDFRQQNVDLSRELYEGSDDNAERKLALASALSGLADVQRRIPLTDRALLNLQESVDLLTQLAEEDSDNPLRRWDALMRGFRMMQIRQWSELPENLSPEMQTRKQELDTFYLEGQLEDFKASVEYAAYLLAYSRFARKAGRKEEADRVLDETRNRLLSLFKYNPEHREIGRLLAFAWFEIWTNTGMLPSDEAATLLDGYLVDPEQATSCDEASLAAKLEVMRGNKSLAKYYTLYLLGKGFFEPGFVAFCKRSDLCN